jgi:hypothetical protein
MQEIVRGIDHLIVMVRHLDRSESAWRALGFATTPRGFHQSGGTANHLIMLRESYIELLGMTAVTIAGRNRENPPPFYTGCVRESGHVGGDA